MAAFAAMAGFVACVTFAAWRLVDASLERDAAANAFTESCLDKGGELHGLLRPGAYTRWCIRNGEVIAKVEEPR